VTESIRPPISDIQPTIQSVITVADWLSKLDDDNKGNECSLNTEPFLDLAGYLKTSPPADDSQKVFEWFYETAKTIVTAQNAIAGMRKQQTGK